MPSTDYDSSVWPPEAALARRGPHIFFVLASFYAALVLVLWVGAYQFSWLGVVPAVIWHAHEMLYGFAAAGTIGLLAAVVPRWSGALPFPDTTLAFLAIVWFLGRVAMLLTGLLPAWLIAIFDLSFLPLSVWVIVVPHLATRLARNLPFLVVLTALWLGDLLMHGKVIDMPYAVAERGARLGLDTYLLLIAAIGGQAIPDATNRFLASQGLQTSAHTVSLLDRLAVVAVLVYLISDAVAGPSVGTSIVALLAGCLNGTRLILWRGYLTVKAPTILALHLGFLWMVLGLLLEAIVPVWGGVADMAAIHVLTVGAIGMMLFALISCESGIHGGHGLTAGPVIITVYALVTLAAVLRVAALFVPGGFVDLIIASGAIWALGALAVCTTYLPIGGPFAPRKRKNPS
jgi:uncharacterized protein involved in response to NO